MADTDFGPLTKNDRDFVVEVHAAGLLELPAGRLALKKGTAGDVRAAGQRLVNADVSLDATCRKAATRLEVTLPDKLSLQQQTFLTAMTNDRGKQFDSDFANVLWTANSRLLPRIADIRTTTRNTLIRQLADQADTSVLDHMTALEKTGLVDYDQVA
ncbi:DUF4142 domain-containing protein [Streptomyces sp. NPDC054794]